MPDRWFFVQVSSRRGPVTYEGLKQRAAAGDLMPTDLVWPEGGDVSVAAEAESLLPPAAFQRATAPIGDWLDKVAKALAAKPASSGATPDWLADVEEEGIPSASPGSTTPMPSTMPVVDVEPVGPTSGQPAPYPPRLIIGGASSRGKVRERNEDRYQTRLWNWNDADGTHEVALLVVSDGMGGYQAGDEASSLTVRTVVAQFDRMVTAATGGRRTDSSALAAAVDQALREANRVVAQQAATDPRCKEMGATAAVVLIWDGRAYLGHVGDCRVYLHRGGELKQLTKDQTLVAKMVALGQLTREEAAEHESRNEVTQAIGKRPTIEPSRANLKLERDDYLVVACDGLAAHVECSTIQQVLSRPTVPPQHLAAQLVQMADDGGGTDNCTVVVAHYH